MKRSLVTCLLLGIVSVLHAQELSVEPSQQAKSYLNSKNVSVDHSTGIFYYKVPLFEIRMGDYSLPISLDYTAKGVKTDDVPGDAGYNWNLNVGGVVTRMIRGGITDENPSRGAAYNWDYLAQGAIAALGVNERQADGESDIFTAVFNGRSVNFVIRVQDACIKAIPLEPTDVKIECLSPQPPIYGWKITDEEGNVYTFAAAEWCGVVREGTVESNSLAEPYYISSWFLLNILPVNKPLIEYEYYRNVNQYDEDRDSVLYRHVSSRTTVRYLYGEPVVEHPCDFSKYKVDFDLEIDRAYWNFQWENTNYYDRIIHSELYNSLNDFYQNASLDRIIPLRILQNLKTMGILYDLKYVNQAYRGLITVLDEMILECNSSPSTPNIRQIITHLNNAKQIVINCREEVNEVYQKDVYQFNWRAVKSPMLKRIKSVSNVIEFKYSRGILKNFLLDKIIVYDMNNDSVRSICLTRDDPYKALPNEISFHDRLGEKVSNIKFDYYDFDCDHIRTNIYGDYIGYTGPTSELYRSKQRFFYHGDDNSFYNSLKTIHVSNDVEIGLYYSLNEIALAFNGREKYGECGGIRIGAINITDKLTGKVDEVYYNYSKGTYVLPQIGNNLTINYPSGFSDVLHFDRLYNSGPDAYVKQGNNGVYYSVVRETFGEKGYIIYNFEVPDMSDSTYNYWNIGKPLGMSFYSSNGRLQKVIRYEYDEKLALPNKKYIDQIKACEYYVSPYGAPAKYGNDPYFKDNMEKRLEPILPRNQGYRIAYDYGVYLKRISEYDFESASFSGRTDYLKESSCYKKTEFEYDPVRSTFPVKTTVTGGDGTKYVEIVKRALDFDDSEDAGIPLLKASNMVGVPLKIQVKVVDHDGAERLLTEQVYRYEKAEMFNNVLLTHVYEYAHDGTSVERVGRLFGFDETMYDKTTVIYEPDGLWTPISTENRGDRMEMQHDYWTGNIVMRASLVPKNSVAACDYKRYKILRRRPAFKFSNALSIKYKLIVVTTSMVAENISLTIKKGETTTTRSFTTKANYLGPQMFDLDLTAITGIEEISMPTLNEHLVYVALVPTDCEFEATSYNADGTVYCKFDHNGQTERYEYDGAGRVNRVFDRDGNLLQEKSYHVVIQ